MVGTQKRKRSGECGYRFTWLREPPTALFPFIAKGTYGEIDWHPIPFDHRGLVKPVANNDSRLSPGAGVSAEMPTIAPSGGADTTASGLRRDLDGERGYLHPRLAFEAEIHCESIHELHATLKEAGFSPYRASCRYKTVLQQRELRLGVSYGKIAKERVWARQPAYVHQMMDERDTGSLHRAVDKVVRQKDLQDAWNAFFPTLRFSGNRRSSSSSVVLDAGEIQSIGAGLLRSFVVPVSDWDMIGEEVEVEIGFESVVPQRLPVFFVFFPWLTLGCEAHITINGKLTILHYFRREFGKSVLEVQTDLLEHKGEAQINTQALVLPGSQVELRWVYLDRT